MKVCPVCQARCFDDMDVCYGCLHRFDGSQQHGVLADEDLDVDEAKLPEYLSDRPVRNELAVDGGIEGSLVVRVEIPAALLLSAAACVQKGVQ